MTVWRRSIVVSTLLIAACSGHASSPSTSPATTLPPALRHSAAGYELYSWPADDQWHFTVITGTNRLKSREEVTSGVAGSSSALARVSVEGVDALEAVMGRLAAGEELI